MGRTIGVTFGKKSERRAIGPNVRDIAPEIGSTLGGSTMIYVTELEIGYYNSLYLPVQLRPVGYLVLLQK